MKELMLIGAALIAFAAVPAQAQDDTMPGHDLHWIEFCDLSDGAPISDKCYGYIGALVDLADSNRGVVRACIPRSLSIEQIFATIKPRLRSTDSYIWGCGGLCSDTANILGGLAEVYPCQQ